MFTAQPTASGTIPAASTGAHHRRFCAPLCPEANQMETKTAPITQA